MVIPTGLREICLDENLTRYGTGKLAKEIIDRMEKLALYMEITL